MVRSALFDDAIPEHIPGDLAALRELPAAARDDFWAALEPSLGEVLSPSIEPALEAFCARTGAPRDGVARSLRAARLIFRTAARRGLSKPAFLDEVRGLAGADADAVADVLGEAFAPAMGKLEQEIAARTLAGHGKVLTDFEWRLETVGPSSHGAALRMPIVSITLRYEEHGQAKAITLQGLPAMWKRLQSLLAAILG